MAKRRKKKGNKLAIPKIIYAQVSPHSVGGVSLFDAGNKVNEETVENFSSEENVVNQAAHKLQEAGFEILQITPTTINISGSAKTYEEAFNTPIVAEERPVIKAMAEETTATFLDAHNAEMPGLISMAGSSFASLIEGVAIEEPYYPMAASMFPPTKEYWHLNVPADVSLGCNADRAHRGGITGKGIKVAMVDSGWYKHPFFVNRGYRASPVVLGPATANPLKDESGHGTGESANIFSVAPDIQLLPVKINFVNSTGAFNAAVGLNPDIITNSWGSTRCNSLTAANQALAAAVATAVASGITVIFSAGNGHWGFPGQHPDVISAGGVYMNVDGKLKASDYASGFMSNIYPNRRVPDLSGLVGIQPRAIYIMLPVEPSDSIDTGNSGGTHPNGDETANNDGWAAFSGTSAAAPQLAGAAALVKQACPRLTPRQIKSILMRSAKDVTRGRSSRQPSCNGSTGRNRTTRGPDTATGHGLVDAYKAALLAKLKCFPIIGPPIRPPIQPPIQPPIRPPIRPIQPPIRPIQPPIRPVTPNSAAPGDQMSEAVTDNSEQTSEGGMFSNEDLDALEEMVKDSDIDLDDLKS